MAEDEGGGNGGRIADGEGNVGGWGWGRRNEDSRAVLVGGCNGGGGVVRGSGESTGNGLERNGSNDVARDTGGVVPVVVPASGRGKGSRVFNG